MDNNAPEIGVVKAVAEKYLNGIMNVERVLKGQSTYVYRVITDSGMYYTRFLPENASFAAEALVHNTLCDAGIGVPRVICFEHKNAYTGLSVMIVDEMPGVCIEDEWPRNGLQDILHEAGRQLALIHNIPVDGFGWIDRSFYETLRGQRRSFNDYFTSDEERSQIADLMGTARRILDIPKAVLVHGDYDISHIFYSAGKYSGLIDFGEIRGNNRLFDLATFSLNDSSLKRIAYSYLIEGYRSIARLTGDDLYSIEYMALYIVLRFLGKKVDKPGARDFFFHLAERQLERINNL